MKPIKLMPFWLSTTDCEGSVGVPGWRKNLVFPLRSSLLPYCGLPCLSTGFLTTQYWPFCRTVMLTSAGRLCSLGILIPEVKSMKKKNIYMTSNLTKHTANIYEMLKCTNFTKAKQRKWKVDHISINKLNLGIVHLWSMQCHIIAILISALRLPPIHCTDHSASSIAKGKIFKDFV